MEPAFFGISISTLSLALLLTLIRWCRRYMRYRKRKKIRLRICERREREKRHRSIQNRKNWSHKMRTRQVKQGYRETSLTTLDKVIQSKDRSDTPVTFGWNQSWFAIRSEDTQKIAEKLFLEGSMPCNWMFGLRRATYYHNTLVGEVGKGSPLFVTPPLHGWSFVVDTGCWEGETQRKIIMELGKTFPEVQAFDNISEMNAVGFMRVQKGKLVRAFIAIDGIVCMDEGEQTEEETMLHFISGKQLRSISQGLDYKKRYNEAAKKFTFPNAESIYALAGAWSLDPSNIQGMGSGSGLGMIGVARADNFGIF